MQATIAKLETLDMNVFPLGLQPVQIVIKFDNPNLAVNKAYDVIPQAWPSFAGFSTLGQFFFLISRQPLQT